MHPIRTAARVRVLTATTPPTELVVPPRAVVTPARVYRGDSRCPFEIFRTGFRIRGDVCNTDFEEYGLRNAPSPWLGCSRRERQAACFPQRAHGSTWVYEIDRPGSGIDLNRVLGLDYLFRQEREVVFLHDIPPSRVTCAVRWSWGVPTHQIVVNPLHA